jgi:hypothetical protein
VLAPKSMQHWIVPPRFPSLPRGHICKSVIIKTSRKDQSEWLL